MRTVAIVGVGLIGGSFARAIRAVGFEGRILGVSSPAVVREAVELGVIDQGATLEEAAPVADLLYLAQPIRRILETLGRLGGLVREDALVTDAGSTKAAIVTRARKTVHRGLFLGGHPMAGKESRGVAESDAKLFRGRTYLLSPMQPEDMQREQAVEFVKLLTRIGAEVHVLPAEQHDRLVALTSHLPQLASTALAATLQGQTRDSDLVAAGPGLFDTTRLALSSFEIWADILATNQPAVDAALESYIRELERLRCNLRESSVEAQFSEGAKFRARLRDVRGL